MQQNPPVYSKKITIDIKRIVADEQRHTSHMWDTELSVPRKHLAAKLSACHHHSRITVLAEIAADSIVHSVNHSDYATPPDML